MGVECPRRTGSGAVPRHVGCPRGHRRRVVTVRSRGHRSTAASPRTTGAADSSPTPKSRATSCSTPRPHNHPRPDVQRVPVARRATRCTVGRRRGIIATLRALHERRGSQRDATANARVVDDQSLTVDLDVGREISRCEANLRATANHWDIGLVDLRRTQNVQVWHRYPRHL